ncbi:hypothetical protein O3P69_001154 [Scylla paramamosain]|uniref:Homeobox domain-containing protein n=1 Tax=Scylla paramamosain TaxID=85552 RepID=A0AAW0UQY0_SCYPA
MGPIRAFSRPSLAAGEFVASATPYSHTPGFSASRRPCSAHASTSLGPQHTVLPHPHLYSSVCAAGPLHAGLVSSPAAPQPCLFHFGKLLPPGAAPPDTHLAAPAHQDTRSASQRATGHALGHERQRKDIYEHGWKNGSECEWKNKDERKLKKKSSENIWKKHKQESKWKQHNGSHKRSAKKSEYKWEKFGDAQLWTRGEDDNKRKNKKEKLKWNKAHREQHDSGTERRRAKWSKDKPARQAVAAPASRAEEPCTSRITCAFPFSDDDDDDDYGHEGKGNKEGNAESWPISDIVETEDEEAESQAGHARDAAAAEASQCAPSGLADAAVGEAESAGVLHQPLPSAVDDVKAIITQNGSEGEGACSDPRNALEWQDSPPPGEQCELLKESDVDDENNSEEQMEHDDERKRRPGEEDYPRDSVRATQRLRPRSYRQFLLTRERKSRVFLKERSYHLGRWFVTHFTHPYPSKDQKDELAARTSMTRNQVSEWFGNMRRRIREATRGLGVCWEERVRLYNKVITGKSEPLPIQPGDAINTWVPPVAEESPSLDQQEEVCASPKFKKALMQRYLNNSFEAPPHHPSGGDSRPSSTPTPSVQQEEDLNTSQGYHKSSESSKSSPVTYALPLCTSSPKESFQARWNTSFQNVKVTKFPAVTTRFLDKGDVRVRPFGGRGQGEEEGKIVRKYERQRNQDYSSANFKKQKTERDSFQSSSPCCSSSLPLDPRKAAGDGWRALASTSTAHFQPSPWMVRRPVFDVRSSDKEGGAGCCTRKPEELAAAYTLMELHTDTAAAHLMSSAPCPPSLSS